MANLRCALTGHDYKIAFSRSGTNWLFRCRCGEQTDSFVEAERRNARSQHAAYTRLKAVVLAATAITYVIIILLIGGKL